LAIAVSAAAVSIHYCNNKLTPQRIINIKHLKKEKNYFIQSKKKKINNKNNDRVL